MIEVRDLCLTREGKAVIDGLSFSVKEKELVVIKGENGSGKSTLALFLAGLMPEIVDSRVKGSYKLEKDCGLVMQNPMTQFIGLTVRDEVPGYALRKYGLAELADKNVFELSCGQQQKVNLISNISRRNKALVLDEPLELLDPKERQAFTETIRKLKGSLTIIWLEKDAKADHLADSLIRLSDTSEPEPSKRRSIMPGKEVLSAEFYSKQTRLHCPKLSVKAGEIIGVIGLNGSGKTTFIKSLAKIAPFRGNVSSIPLSYSPQDSTHLLFEDTVREEFCRYSDLSMSKGFRLAGILDSDPNRLSKGQQKCVANALALGAKDLVLLDEPTTWLDSKNRSTLYGELAKTKKTVIMATHDPGLLRLCDRIYKIEGGELRECSNTIARAFFQGCLKH